MHSSRPEHEVLLLAGRRELDREQRAMLRRLLAEVGNWDYLLLLASHHGLIPLLHKHLHATGADLLPVDVLSRLKRHSINNAQNALHLLGRQAKVCRLFTENDLRVAVLKGSVLSQMAYGEISLREAGDIDLLISRADFFRAKELLESLGYEMTPSLTRAQLESHLRSHCEIQFVRDDWFTVVDLHWALAPKNFVFKLDTDDVLSRLQRVDVAGTPVETLATEDAVLYLAMHGAKHLWRAVEWITSLGELIRSAESISWEVVVERAERAHATRMLGLALRLVESVSGLGTVPQALGAVIKDKSMQTMAEEVLLHIFDIAGAAVSTETNLNNLKIMDRKRDALLSALRAIFVPTLSDWDSLKLPPSLHTLYYAYRPLRLSKVYTTSAWRKLNSRGAACL